MNDVRLGWLYFHATGKRPRRSREDSSRDKSRAQLRKAFTDSGRTVAGFLEKALGGAARTRMWERAVDVPRRSAA